MPDISAILVAALTGFISGLLLSIPVGPVNLSVMNEAAREGFKHAAFIGAGASGLETFYCAIAFSGFAGIFQEPHIKLGMEIFTFVFLLYLGVKFLRVKTVPTSSAGGKRLQGILHPKSGFMTGVVMVLGNPGVLLFWIILAANFVNRGWVHASLAGRGACVFGVALGTAAWFTGLAYACSFGHKKFSDKTLLKMEHGSGWCLLFLSLVHGGEVIWQMAKHK